MACVLTCTSPSPGGGGRSTSEISSFRSETRRSARIREFPAGEGNERAKGLKPMTARRQPRWFGKFARVSGRLAREHEAYILPAEAEGIGDRGPDLGVARDIWNHVERNRGIRHLVIDRGRNALILDGEECEHLLDRPRRGERVPDHRLV